MAQLMDYAGYLSKEIGPRPAGTEEEQQAALYITEQIQKEAGFTANIEEFSNSTNFETSRAILASVTIVVTLLSLFFSVLAIPAFILCAAAAAVYTLESLDKPIIARVLSRGASQNVVSKYQPNYDGSEEGGASRARTRKIVLVAHYDTGRVKPGVVDTLESTGLPLPLICVVAMIFAAFLQLIRIFVAAGGGMGLIVLNVLSIVAILVCALPVARALLMRSAPYNEGANNNATGTAALIEIARRISRGSVSEADLAQGTDEDLHIHGEEAAREAGLIPEGAQIRYEAQRLVPPSELGKHDEEDRLLAAKAAIAALTGKPVEKRVYGSVADKLVNSYADEDGGEFQVPAQVVAPYDASNPAQLPQSGEAEGVQMAATSETAEGFQNAPSWFIAAQKNAKRLEDSAGSTQVQRSKYTEAMEYAERERADKAEEARKAEQAQRDAEARARQEEVRAAIQESNQPSVETPLEPAIDGRVGQAAAESKAIGVSPGSTIAMAQPVPVEDIRTELAALEPVAVEEAAPKPVTVPSIADDIPAITHEPVARNRIAQLPSIDPSAPSGASGESATTASPSRSGMFRKLRTNVPSLSGLIKPVGSDDQRGQSGAATRGGAPNASAAAANRAAARRAVVDAVPAVVNVPTPIEAAQPAEEPVDYNMEVPRSRAGSLLGRMRGSDSNDMSDTPQEWLNVDENFEARSVGRDRGSWESFRDDRYFDDDDGFGEFGSGDDERRTRRRWEGGAYSRKQLGHVNMRSGADSDADAVVPEELPENEVDRSLTGEIEQIYHFRNPQFNTEIWFVAIGSDGEGHDGARAFIEEHADELRGSMVIEIESLGAGALSVATEEGRVRKVTASSRVKRYTRGAVSATGIAVDDVSLAGSDSIASVVQKAGYQSMHLFGAENGRPALKGSADDVLENVDELLFDDHVNFIYELLKH